MRIYHWRKLDERDRYADDKGWYCWVYTDSPEELSDFRNWCENHLTDEDEFIYRFNSGSPMTTVHIVDEDRAMLFKLTYSDNFSK